MKSITLMPWLFVAWILLFISAVPPGLAIEAPLEDAILKSDWNKIHEILGKDGTRSNDPVARLLMGHACLATNRNNASMLLFVSVKEEDDSKSWSEWTESLVLRHPHNPVGLYLSADAKARAGRLEEAIEGFTQALQIKDDFALAFNARGVVRVLTNDWDNAQVDFYLATKFAPHFADGYASLGMLGVLRETSLDLDSGTLEAFNQALNINPEFALAYNGRGCIYFGAGQFEEAARDFRSASELSPILVTAEVNQGFTFAYASKLITLAGIEKKPGTTFESLHRQYPNVLKEQQQQLLNQLPTKSDQKFWNNIDVLPALSNDQLQAFVQDYGLQKVHMGASLKTQELSSKITQSYLSALPFPEKNDFSNRLSSVAFSSFVSDKGIRGDWTSFVRPISDYAVKDKVMSDILGTPSASGNNLTIYVTDFGINQWKPQYKMFDGFSQAKASVVPNLPKQNQILLPMPADDHFPKTPAEHRQLTLEIYQGLKQRIGDSEFGTHEIQIVQNISTAGYFVPWRQNMVKEFGADVYNALGMLKNDLTSKGLNVDMPAVVGSNGAYLLTETLPQLKNNPIDRATLVDGRAYVTPTKETYKILGGNLTGINTAGDAPALPGIPAVPNLIANHDVMKGLKRDLPDMKVFWVDAKGLDIFVSKHLKSMNPESQLSVKEFDGRGYTTPTKMSGWDLISKSPAVDPLPSYDFSSLRGGPTEIFMNAAQLPSMERKLTSLGEISTSVFPKQPPSQIPGYYTSVDRPLTEISALASMVDKSIKPMRDLPRSALIVSQDPFRTNLLQSELSKYGIQTKLILPESDPQIEARRWGADVILGIRGAPEMRMSEIKSLPTDIESRQVTLPEIKQSWNWAKPYTPTYPKGAPGGISTEELAKSFVDKGNWPVITSFGLFYQAGSSTERQKEEGEQ